MVGVKQNRTEISTTVEIVRELLSSIIQRYSGIHTQNQQMAQCC